MITDIKYDNNGEIVNLIREIKDSLILLEAIFITTENNNVKCENKLNNIFLVV